MTTTTVPRAVPADPVAPFLTHARARPDAPASCFGGRTSSYGELDDRSAAIAAELYGAGVRPGDVVGVFADRGTDAVVSTLAVLRVGAAYVTVDPRSGRQRQRFIAADARIRAAISAAGPSVPVPPGVPVIGPNGGSAGRLPELPVDPRLPAYISYTSGSTGTPKGVVVSRAALATFARSLAAAWNLSPGSVCSGVCPITWDGYVIDTWVPLLAGAFFDAVPEVRRTNPDGIARHVADHGVEALLLPTALGELMLNSPLLARASSLRHLMLAGHRLIRWASPGIGYTLWNGYGPTEATVLTTMTPVPASGPGLPPIGRPLPGVDVDLVDDELCPVPAGGTGEIVVGGVGVAEGYAGNPRHTAAAFVPAPRGRRRYRSGDLARVGPDGMIEFIGRRDRQVSLNGHRVELDGLGALLRRSPDVADAWADLLPGSDSVVVAVVPAGAGCDEAALADLLRDWLPPQQPPARLLLVDSIPFTPLGKPDRDELRRLADLAAPPPQPDHAPGELDELDECVLDEYRAVLPGAGADDSFFALGGTSLQAVTLVQRLQHGFEIELSLVAFFQWPTPRVLAELIRQELKTP